MEEEKVKGVLDWPTSKGVKNIQKFLGLASYYQQFIKDFTTIARPCIINTAFHSSPFFICTLL